MNNLQKKINNLFPNEKIEVIHYTIMKEPATIRCLNCNTEYTLKRAENFIRPGKKCVCKKCINNGSGGRLTLEKFQEKINNKYQNEKLQVLKYTLKDEECSIKCLKCNSIFTLKNAESFLRSDKIRVCKTCIPNKIEELNHLKKNFLKYIEKKDTFEILSNIESNFIKSTSIIEGKCKKCGYVSGRTMGDYLRGRGCPKCANNMIYTNQEYQEILGDEYTLLGEYKGMKHQVLLRHNLCGFCYSRNARHYTCPKCSGSKGEKVIAFLLEKNDISYEREKQEKINNHLLRFDFYLNDYDCYIEYQGIQHYEPVDYFGGQKSFNKQQEYDKNKIKWIKKNNKKMLIIRYDDDIKDKLFKFLLKFNDHLERE